MLTWIRKLLPWLPVLGQRRCMGYGVEQDTGAHSIVVGEMRGPEPQNADPAQSSWEPGRSPQWQKGPSLLLPWSDRT